LTNKLFTKIIYNAKKKLNKKLKIKKIRFDYFNGFITNNR